MSFFALSERPTYKQIAKHTTKNHSTAQKTTPSAQTTSTSLLMLKNVEAATAPPSEASGKLKAARTATQPPLLIWMTGRENYVYFVQTPKRYLV